MNRIVIKINELGPVKNQWIELAPVMLFTGESSLGKSYVNFLSYYVFNVFSSERLDKFIADHFPPKLPEIKDFKFSMPISELAEWMKDDVSAFFVYLYHYDQFKCDVEFEFPESITAMEFEFRNRTLGKTENESYHYDAILNDKVVETVSMDRNLERSVSRSFKHLVCEQLLGLYVSKTILLPPGRASLLSSDFTVQRGASRLGVYDMFLRDNDWINARRLWNIKGDGVNNSLVSQIQELIKGSLMTEKDRLFLVTKDGGTPIPLDAAASSIRELTPLLQWMLGGSIADQSVCLEEPEAHLHPEMQMSIANLLTSCIQAGAYMQITTHSDYFMQRINQLIKYGIIREKNEKAYEALCKNTGHRPERYLDRKLLKTYFFSSEGGSTVITPLEIDENGIPLSTVFHAVEELTAEDDILNEELEKVEYHA